MNSQHGFYLLMAYGVGALLLVFELLFLWQRCRSARKLIKDEQP